MIIKPMIRSNICINSHPVGCAKETERQIEYVKQRKHERGTKSAAEGGKGPKTVLVLGGSTGYGLAARITAAFEYGADTIGVSLEKCPTQNRGGTPGWYNNMAFDRMAARDGLKSVSLNIDAFSHDARRLVIEKVKEWGRTFDLVVYSLASPVRTDPDTGIMYRSVIKPSDKAYSGVTIDMMTGKMSTASAEPATKEEIKNTVKVMGGEDWMMWIKALSEAGVLSRGVRTIAFSYIGPAMSHPIYRDGSIGEAKKDLEATALRLNDRLKALLGGAAYISVNKGLVTRSSAVIPIISLYISIMFKVMKERGTHEDCAAQMERLFAERLYTGEDGAAVVPDTDYEHRIRIDNYEMDSETQKEIAKRMERADESNIAEIGDMEGYKHDFLAINGFDISGVDYSKDVPRMDTID